MSSKLPSEQRRDFLGSVAAATAAVLGAAVSAPMAQAAEPTAGGGNEFQRWLDAIPGKYRQLYDAPEPNGGMALMWSHVFMMTAAQSFGVPESEVGVVVALRHAAMPLALGDAVWAKYKLGEFFKIDDPQTKTPALRNPFANLKPGDLPLPEAAIEKLVARNVKFATCAMAIHHYSMRYAKEHGGEHEAIKKEWMAAVMPGIFVALSGVLAVHGAQSKGCTYCFAG
jgi:hypothetical protein